MNSDIFYWFVCLFVLYLNDIYNQEKMYDLANKILKTLADFLEFFLFSDIFRPYDNFS